MRIPFRLADVFTDRPLAGNQLCVIPEGPALPDQLMQAVAREIGFSETTFVTEASGDRYSMRIFTPASELPFAGHPTLGTVFVLVAEGRITSPAMQSVPGGEFRVEADPDAGTAGMQQGQPVFGGEISDLGSVARMVGLTPADLRGEWPPQVVTTGLPHLIVGLREEGALARARPDGGLLGGFLESVGADGCYVFASSEEGMARARMFATGIGISEDPATGSAAGPLGAYLVARGMAEGRLTVTQGVEMGRPSTLLVDVARGTDGWNISVGGGVVQVGRGYFDLPD
jgi:trans-2,3-dihydro-3-hydroxyanthranilate isomerase